MGSDNYAYDFYTWEQDKRCADKIAQRLSHDVVSSIGPATLGKRSRKEAIHYAIRTNDFSNYPDTDSNSSIDSNEFGEIHSYASTPSPTEKKPSCFSTCFKKNKILAYIITWTNTAKAKAKADPRAKAEPTANPRANPIAKPLAPNDSILRLKATMNVRKGLLVKTSENG